MFTDSLRRLGGDVLSAARCYVATAESKSSRQPAALVVDDYQRWRAKPHAYMPESTT